ncbi:hypothetical protein EDB85DRAFT_2000719, partial [Lactarius pseudohatsudake]
EIAAGIVSLLNDFRLSKGEPPLGFLNYWLYDDRIANLCLNDITSGSNPGCLTSGFSASTGWDPVCPGKLVFLRRWLTVGSIGDGSRDDGLCQAGSNTC